MIFFLETAVKINRSLINTLGQEALTKNTARK